MTFSCFTLPLIRALETAAERTMPKKPTPSLKGIPIGSYEQISDAAGKMTIKPKVKRKPLPAQYASKNRKKWRAVK